MKDKTKEVKRKQRQANLEEKAKSKKVLKQMEKAKELTGLPLLGAAKKN